MNKAYQDIETVGELIDVLQDFNRDWPVFMNGEEISVIYVRPGDSEHNVKPSVEINQ